MSDAQVDTATRTTERSRPAMAPWLVLAAVLAAAAVGLLLVTRGTDDAGGIGSTEDVAIPLTTADGGSTTLAEFGGAPLVVNFFASWCPPCRAEMPELEQVHQEVGDEFRFLGVSVDYDETTWKSLVAESGITFETVFEPRQDLLRAVGGRGMPTTILVAADGEIVYVHTGALDADSLRRHISERLA